MTCGDSCIYNVETETGFKCYLDNKDTTDIQDKEDGCLFYHSHYWHCKREVSEKPK